MPVYFLGIWVDSVNKNKDDKGSVTQFLLKFKCDTQM